MEIYTMKQLRNEHRKVVEAGRNVSLMVFAADHGAVGVITRAHQAASKTRSPEKKDRTRAATASKKTSKKSGTQKPTTVVAAGR